MVLPIRQSKMKLAVWIMIAILAPFVFMSIELLVAHRLAIRGATWAYTEIALAMIIGVYCLWRLPVSITKRVWLTVAFTPISIGLLILYSLWFICIAFGDCI
jgi:hypothetical protein